MGLYIWQAFRYRYANVDSLASLQKEEGESAGLVVAAVMQVDVGAALDGIGP